MDYQDLHDIAKLCANSVHPQTIIEIAKTESNLNQFAVNVNGIDKSFQINKLSDALEVVEIAKEKDKTFDVGLMQINSRNLERFGIKPQDAFEPCLNIRLGAIIISEFYQRAIRHTNDPQVALQKALSAYNTGSLVDGFSNGYVEKYYSTPAPKVSVEETPSNETSESWLDKGVQDTELEPTTDSPVDWSEFLDSKR